MISEVLFRLCIFGESFLQLKGLITTIPGLVFPPLFVFRTLKAWSEFSKISVEFYHYPVLLLARKVTLVHVLVAV